MQFFSIASSTAVRALFVDSLRERSTALSLVRFWDVERDRLFDVNDEDEEGWLAMTTGGGLGIADAAAATTAAIEREDVVVEDVDAEDVDAAAVESATTIGGVGTTADVEATTAAMDREGSAVDDAAAGVAEDAIGV